MKLRRLGWALAALALPLPALASTLTESDFFAEMPLVLTGSRLSQPTTQSPAPVSIIDQDMIRASGLRDIPELLRLVPGFTVAYTRDNTWGVGYHGMADAFSRRMQVLIDGRSVYLPGFGNTPWNILPITIEDIERIEVVRGPNAAAYGANSFFGVINIITKEPSQVPGAFVSAQAGEQSNSGVMGRYGGSRGDFRYRLSLSDQRRDRFDTQAEQTNTQIIDFRGDHRLSNTDELSIDFAASRGDWRQGRSSDPTDPVRHNDVGTEQLQTKFRRVVDPGTEWSLQFYHIRSFVDDDYVAKGVPVSKKLVVDVPIDKNETQWREDIEFQMINTLNDLTRLVWGAEARWEGVDAKGYFYGKDRRSGDLYRLFGNIEWHPAEQWIVNAGIMAENHYFTDLDVSPRIAVNYLPSPDHALRASISEAYRSPTFFEEQGDVRFFTTTGIYLGQRFAPGDDLQPEKILSREIGYVGYLRPLSLRVDARLFFDEVRQVIGQNTVKINGAKTFQADNNHHAEIRGAETQLRWQPHPDFELILNYAHVHIDSDETDIEDSAPANNFSALGIYRLPHGWEASVAVYRVGQTEWLDDGNTTDQYTRVDARLARRWKWQGHETELSVVGQNLGGDSYQEFRGDNLYDRRAYVGLTLNW